MPLEFWDNHACHKPFIARYQHRAFYEVITRNLAPGVNVVFPAAPAPVPTTPTNPLKRVAAEPLEKKGPKKSKAEKRKEKKERKKATAAAEGGGEGEKKPVVSYRNVPTK